MRFRCVTIQTKRWYHKNVSPSIYFSCVPQSKAITQFGSRFSRSWLWFRYSYTHMNAAKLISSFVIVCRFPALPSHSSIEYISTERERKNKQTVKYTHTHTQNTCQKSGPNDCNHISILLVLLLPGRLSPALPLLLLTLIQFFNFSFCSVLLFTHFMRCTSVIALCVNGHVSILMIQIWRFGICECVCFSFRFFLLNWILLFFFVHSLTVFSLLIWYNMKFKKKRKKMTRTNNNKKGSEESKTKQNQPDMENKLLMLRPLLPPSIIFEYRNDHLFNVFLFVCSFVLFF